MRVQLKTDGVSLTDADHDVLWRHIDALEAWLEHVEPDLIHLEVALEAQPRRTAFTGHVRLVIMNQVLTEQRAMLDRALAGDRASFDRLAETQLAGVRKVIFDELTAAGHDITTRELDAELARVLARAFEQLDRKPERWSLHGWLAYVARQELRGRVHA